MVFVEESLHGIIATCLLDGGKPPQFPVRIFDVQAVIKTWRL
jgi:hypothetical protein